MVVSINLKKTNKKDLKNIAKLQSDRKPSTDELLFHPEIQSIFEQCITLIRNDEKDDAVDILIGLMDFSQEIWKNKVLTQPNKWVMMERPIGLQWYYACIAIIKRGIYPYNMWLQQIMSSWFHNCLLDGVIQQQTYINLMKQVGVEPS